MIAAGGCESDAWHTALEQVRDKARPIRGRGGGTVRFRNVCECEVARAAATGRAEQEQNAKEMMPCDTQPLPADRLTEPPFKVQQSRIV